VKKLNKVGDMIYKNKNIVERQVADSFFLINIKESYADSTCHLYEINQVGDYIWNRIDKSKSEKEIADSLYELIKNEVPYGDVYNDVKSFIKVLADEKFLEIR